MPISCPQAFWANPSLILGGRDPRTALDTETKPYPFEDAGLLCMMIDLPQSVCRRVLYVLRRIIWNELRSK